MGSLISAVRSQLTAADDEAQKNLKDRLLVLEELGKSRVSAMKLSLIEKQNTYYIPIQNFLNENKGYRVDISTGALTELSAMVDDFFGGNNNEGLKKLITIAITALFGRGTAGTIEESKYYIVITNDTLCRVDFMYYKYQISYEGIYAQAESLFCWQLNISSIDVEKIDKSVIVYALTQQTNTSVVNASSEEFTKVMEEKIRLLNALDKLWDRPTVVRNRVVAAPNSRIALGLSADKSNEGTDKPNTDKPNTDTPNTDKPNADTSSKLTINETLNSVGNILPLALIAAHDSILNIANASTGEGENFCSIEILIGFSIIFPLFLIFAGIVGYMRGVKHKFMLCVISLFAYATYMCTAHPQPITCWLYYTGLYFPTVQINNSNLGTAQTCLLIGLSTIITTFYSYYRKLEQSTPAVVHNPVVVADK